jgi:hypothetical protein
LGTKKIRKGFFATALSLACLPRPPKPEQTRSCVLSTRTQIRPREFLKEGESAACLMLLGGRRPHRRRFFFSFSKGKRKISVWCVITSHLLLTGYLHISAC